MSIAIVVASGVIALGLGLLGLSIEDAATTVCNMLKNVKIVHVQATPEDVRNILEKDGPSK